MSKQQITTRATAAAEAALAALADYDFGEREYGTMSAQTRESLLRHEAAVKAAYEDAVSASEGDEDDRGPLGAAVAQCDDVLRALREALGTA